MQNVILMYFFDGCEPAGWGRITLRRHLLPVRDRSETPESRRFAIYITFECVFPPPARANEQGDIYIKHEGREYNKSRNGRVSEIYANLEARRGI